MQNLDEEIKRVRHVLNTTDNRCLKRDYTKYLHRLLKEKHSK